MSDFLNSRLLVTGASGHLGRRTVELLLEAGAKHLVAASRDTQKINDLATHGAELRRADFDDPASLAIAFKDVERVLIVSTDAVSVPGQRLRQHLAAVEAARIAGVRHIVYTSMPHPEPGSAIPFAPDHYETERAIEQSGIGYTILRNNWYADSVHFWLPQVLASGTWFSSAADGRVAYVTREDAARTAAAALRSEVLSRRYDVSGPQALSTAELVAIIKEVFGRSIQLISVSDEQLAEGLSAAGLPPPFVELLVAMDANTRNGGVDVVSETVKRLTGMEPQSLRTFLDKTRVSLAPTK